MRRCDKGDEVNDLMTLADIVAVVNAERRAYKARLILDAARREHRRGNGTACWLFLLWWADFVGGEK